MLLQKDWPWTCPRPLAAASVGPMMARPNPSAIGGAPSERIYSACGSPDMLKLPRPGPIPPFQGTLLTTSDRNHPTVRVFPPVGEGTFVAP